MAETAVEVVMSVHTEVQRREAWAWLGGLTTRFSPTPLSKTLEKELRAYLAEGRWQVCDSAALAS
jgi:hypothetical protein